MASADRTPGVYVEETSTFPPSGAAVETAIPAFIGYTQSAREFNDVDLRNSPKRISSLVEFEKYFGGAQSETGILVTIAETQESGVTTAIESLAELADANRSSHILHYAMQLFFANGGGPCWVVSVGDFKGIGAGPDVNELQAGLNTLRNQDEPTLIVCPESQFLSVANYKTFMDAALLQCADLRDRFVILDLNGAFGGNDGLPVMNASDTALLDVVGSFRNDGIGTNNLRYGAVYGPNIETTLDFVYECANVQVVHSLNGVPEDPTPLETFETEGSVNTTLFDTAQAAINDMSNRLPPSGAIAGVYATVDRTRGVWKAPAGISLATVIGPTIPFSNSEQDVMNLDAASGKSVNAIRAFTGKGTLVWGARTLAGNSHEWRYISVRRFFNFVEESLKKATERFVFEPNEANTWAKVRTVTENFLMQLWRQGALQGTKPEHAFYVAVGLGKTMTEDDILNGEMNVEIGLAAVRPAEFIILRFSHKMAQS